MKRKKNPCTISAKTSGDYKAEVSLHLSSIKNVTLAVSGSVWVSMNLLGGS